MKYSITLYLSLLALGFWSCADDNTTKNKSELSEQFATAKPIEDLKKVKDDSYPATGSEKLDSFISAVPKDRIVHHAKENANSAERAAVDICNCTHFYLKMVEITMEIDPNDVGFRNAYFDVIEKEAPKAERCMSAVKRSYDRDSLNRADPQAFAVEVDKNIKTYCPNLVKVMNTAANAAAKK